MFHVCLFSILLIHQKIVGQYFENIIPGSTPLHLYVQISTFQLSLCDVSISLNYSRPQSYMLFLSNFLTIGMLQSNQGTVLRSANSRCTDLKGREKYFDKYFLQTLRQTEAQRPMKHLWIYLNDFGKPSKKLGFQINEVVAVFFAQWFNFPKALEEVLFMQEIKIITAPSKTLGSWLDSSF